jgi:hypothetical protein
MNDAISNLAGSLSGTHGAGRVVQSDKVRESARKDKAKPSPAEALDVVEVEHAEAVRNLKDETQEEAQEDRQGHPAYDPHGRAQAGGGTGGSIDVAG